MGRSPVTPRLLTPWPYAEVELQRIRDTLPADSADGAIEWAILAAHFFLADRSGPRPNPYQELYDALLASEALTRAVQALTPKALASLPGHPWPGTRDPSHPYDFGGVLSKFEHDCRVALRRFKRAVIGAPVKRRRGGFDLSTVDRMAICHRGEKAGMRFVPPASSPLMTSRFVKKLRPARRTERAWQSLLARARARFEGAELTNFDRLNCVEVETRKAHHLRANRGETASNEPRTTARDVWPTAELPPSRSSGLRS